MVRRIVLQLALIFFIGVNMLMLANRVIGITQAVPCACLDLIDISAQRWCRCRFEGEVVCSYTQWNYDYERSVWIYACETGDYIAYRCFQWYRIGCCWWCSSTPPPCPQPTCH